MSPSQGPAPTAEDKLLVDNLQHQHCIKMESLAVMRTSDNVLPLLKLYKLWGFWTILREVGHSRGWGNESRVRQTHITQHVSQLQLIKKLEKLGFIFSSAIFVGIICHSPFLLTLPSLT